jgi:signal transduction histidine kinase
VRSDPGAVLLLVRQAASLWSSPGFACLPSLLNDPAIPEGALKQLQQPEAGFVDWDRPECQVVYQTSLQIAQWAQHLARLTQRCPAESAWVAGLLAPLGWLAVCAVEPDQVVACLVDPDFPKHPGQRQRRHWGFEHAALARRLARRWHLADWLTAVVGHLGLPVEVARSFGADPDLFRLVQLAVALSQEQHIGLGLSVGASPAELVPALGLPADECDRLRSVLLRCTAEAVTDSAWQSPFSVPLLKDLLLLAAENRRWQGAPHVRQLESNVDDLHRALEDVRAGEAERLQARQLGALAEFAAGAGHEINNPLAVISGQAQYLLSHETDSGRQRALQSIIQQAQRIHQLLRDVMHFARPPHPCKQPLDLPGLVNQAAGALSGLAQERRVRLVCPELVAQPSVCADPAQVSEALSCLLRNAIEAAPPEGWAGIRLETPTNGQVEVVVEDSGPGLAPAQREHLFDPFYSGRQAGRGRGLGLPTAWRLARLQGGDVRYVALPEGPTRFVLRLPRSESTNGQANAGRS